MTWVQHWVTELLFFMLNGLPRNALLRNTDDLNMKFVARISVDQSVGHMKQLSQHLIHRVLWSALVRTNRHNTIYRKPISGLYQCKTKRLEAWSSGFVLWSWIIATWQWIKLWETVTPKPYLHWTKNYVCFIISIVFVINDGFLVDVFYSFPKNKSDLHADMMKLVHHDLIQNNTDSTLYGSMVFRSLMCFHVMCTCPFKHQSNTFSCLHCARFFHKTYHNLATVRPLVWCRWQIGIVMP